MPSTITAYTTFIAATKAKASEVNANFSNYRGNLLPINETTITASNNTHYLGGSTHYWAGAYVYEITMGYMTTTAIPVLSSRTDLTTGGFELKIGGVTTCVFGASGLTNSSLETSSRTIVAQTFVAGNTTWTTPAGHTNLMFIAYGAGGGGGGGGYDSAGHYGGGGGNGAEKVSIVLTVTPLEVLSITVGIGGAGGNGGTAAAGTQGATGGNTIIYRSGVAILTAYGAFGGYGVSTLVGGGGYGILPTFSTPPYQRTQYLGGTGSVSGADGLDGQPSNFAVQGTCAGGGPTGGGGGGGGASYGRGGDGTPGTSTGQAPTAGNGSFGAGGGGGAGHGNGGGAAIGGHGGDGGDGILIAYYTKIT